MAPVRKPFDVDYAARLYRQGRSVDQIAAAMGGCSRMMVWRRLHEHGVPLRTRGVNQDRLALVRTAVLQLKAGLSRQNRVIALMRAVSAASAREISVATGIPYRAVASVMQAERARKARAVQ